jgi:hypothetical protein
MVLVLLMWFGGLLAQNVLSQMTSRPLKPSTSRLLQVPTFGAYGEPQCDDKMGMYYHLADGAYRRTTILRIAPSGDESTLYKLPDESSTTTGFVDFSVTPSGDVAALVEDNKGQAIVFGFGPDGNTASRVQLQLPEHVTTSQYSRMARCFFPAITGAKLRLI